MLFQFHDLHMFCRFSRKDDDDQKGLIGFPEQLYLIDSWACEASEQISGQLLILEL